MNKLIFFVCIFALFISCGKEKSLEASASTSSVFIFGGTPGNCTLAELSGNFVKATVLTSANTVTIEVNVVTTGPYKITTDTVNGYSFAGSGFFSATGTQKVTLKGSGTPILSGTDDFMLSAGSMLPGCIFSVDVLNTAPLPATYTLTGSPNACGSFIINGSYGKDIALTSANTVTVSVDVTTAGSYTISTDTVSGISFSKSGVFSGTGVQQIVLYGNGKPTATGALNFKVKAGSSICSFFLTVSGPSTYTFTGGAGACTGAAVAGNYVKGSALTSSSTVTIQVNVTTIGTYTISTNTVNGYKFSASGTFASTGTQNVTLQASGTPSALGTNNFTLNSNGCTFAVTVTDAPVEPVFQCKVDGVLIKFPVDANCFLTDTTLGIVSNLFELDGLNDMPVNNSASNLSILIQPLDNSVVKTGTYTEKGLTGLTGYLISVVYEKINADGSSTTYQTTSTTPLATNPSFSIIVTSITSSRVKGTFNGKLKDDNGNLITVTEGTFDLPVN